jgi:hypothetical protein
MIDWVSLHIDLEHLAPEVRDYLRTMTDRVCRYNPRTGEVEYDTGAWDSVRSDSHQLALKVGSALYIQGSPARLFDPSGLNVFGPNDLLECARRMIWAVSVQIGHGLPPVQSVDSRGRALWTVTRVDVTRNYVLGSLADVRSALSVLRGCEGGRYRVSQQAGDTVYWSHRSRLRAGKAYAKGPHIRYQMQRGQIPQQPDDDLALYDRLLRLELRLGSQWWRRWADGPSGYRPWWDASPDILLSCHDDYFGRMIGDVEIAAMSDISERVYQVAPSEGQARSALACWAVIQSMGWQSARDTYPPRTWYRHLRILRDAGLSDSDLSAGRITELRRRVLDLVEVSSLAELRAVA